MAQSAPEDALVSMSVFDLLLIELIPLAERMAREYEASLDRPSLANKHPRAPANAPSTTGGTAPTTLAGDGLPETEVFKETMYYRLERLGYRVGQGLSERFSRDRPRFTDQLDVIKFICKDLWTVVFKKQIDNLKTNHRVSASRPLYYGWALIGAGSIRSHGFKVQAIFKDEHGERC